MHRYKKDKIIAFFLQPRVFLSIALFLITLGVVLLHTQLIHREVKVLTQENKPIPFVQPQTIIQKVYAAVDFTRYTQNPYNLPTPTEEIEPSAEQIELGNNVGGHVATYQSYLTSKHAPEYVDPFLSAIWVVAIEGLDTPFFWNCQDSSYDINAGCPNGYYSGGWQVGFGVQVSQATPHITEDFNAVYGEGKADDAAFVKQIGQAVIDAANITNPSTFPNETLTSLASRAHSGDTSARQAIAVLLMDQKLGAVVVALEIAGDIKLRGTWRASMEGWGSYYVNNMQRFSNRAAGLAKHYTGVAGPSSGGTTGGSGSSGNATLKLTVKPLEDDSYVINEATAQAIGGGSGGSSGPGQGAPPGSVDGHCTPTGSYPADPAGELRNKYKILLDGFGAEGTKMIYETVTCLSGSKFPTLISNVTTTVHNAISASLGSIGMDCSNTTCNIWIPESTGASFKFIFTHEWGHVISYTNPRDVTHKDEFQNAFDTEGGLSPYSGGGNGCSGGGMEEDFAEMVAYYYNPTTGGKTGACDNRVNPPNSLFGTENFPLHLEVAKKVL